MNVTTINFTTGATVSNGGAGTANVAAGGSGSFAVLVPTGTIDGANKVFTFSAQPQVVVLDNSTVMNKVNKAPDSTTNWTGTTTITLLVAPTFNIYGY